MAIQSSRITIHMVCSLDGFIAREDNDVSWMHSADTFDRGKTLTDEDVAQFLQDIDCYVMGSRTYEHALKLGWPYGDVPVVVLTSRTLTSDRPSVRFYNGDLEQLVEDQLKPTYRNIWMVGGAMLTREFIRQQLADEVVTTIMPVLLGEGTPFFDHLGVQQPLHLKDVTPYSDGMVELCYELIK